MSVLLVLVVALGLFVWFQRTTELFVLSWRKGELRLVRGRIPPMLRADLAPAHGRLLRFVGFSSLVWLLGRRDD